MKLIPTPVVTNPDSANGHSGPGRIVIGEIRWPMDPDKGVPKIVPATETPLQPDQAYSQGFSILAQIPLPPTNSRASRIPKKLKGLLSQLPEANTKLTTQHSFAGSYLGKAIHFGFEEGWSQCESTE